MFSYLSQQGQEWIDNVRKCLMGTLYGNIILEQIPGSLNVIEPSMTCERIKKIGFESHPNCYVNTNPSFCEVALDSSNWDGLWDVYDFNDLLTDESIKQVL